MFSIGEFSRVTGLPVKTLRFYHEQGILTPSHVDPQTGYRYYADGKIDTARVITQLRQLDFSIADIAEILANCEEESDVLEHLERQKERIQAKMSHFREIGQAIDRIIQSQREAQTAMQDASFEIEEKTVDSLLIAGVRMRGKYSDCGQGFGRIGRRFGRHICGKPLMLIYDHEYKEEDADFEVCMPIRKGAPVEGIDVRQLPGGRCIALLHKGPYDQMGRSYERIFKYAKDQGCQVQTPCREVYLKGPGMIFKGNPKNYLTEIQMLIEEEGGG